MNKDQVNQIFRDRADSQAKPPQIVFNMVDIYPILVFRLENEKFAFKLDDLSEVLSYTSVATVPRSQENVLGILNIGSDIHCVMDLHMILGINKIDKHDSKYILVLKKNKLGLRVDDVEGIRMISDNNLLNKQEEDINLPMHFVKGVIQAENDDDKNVVLLTDDFLAEAS